MNKKTQATMRGCNNCGYKTLVMSDTLNERFCHKCKEGKLEIITMLEEEKEKYGIFLYACEKCGMKFFGLSENRVKNNVTVHELNCKINKA